MRDKPRDDDELVDHIYDVTVEPERLEALIDHWNDRLGRTYDPAQFQLLARTGIIDHVERAERILEALVALGTDELVHARSWVETSRFAAAVVDRSGYVVASNREARETLGLQAGGTLDDLPAAAMDRAVLVDLVATIDSPGNKDVRLLRLALQGDASPILVRVIEAVDGDPRHVGLVTSIVAWPDQLSRQLQSAFGLTTTETAVLKDVTLGRTVRQIAGLSGRGEPTIRSHVKSILAKTGVHSQIELVRLTLGLLAPIESGAMITPLRGPVSATPDPNVYLSLRLPDGRKLDYLSVGAPAGRAFLMLPTDMGFTRLTPPAEAWLAERGMRMIVPVRAGYGGSSPLPKRADAFDVAVADMCALCDALAVARLPILAKCDDFHLAVAMANAVPDRVTAIVALGPTMPAGHPRHFNRMTKWTRFIYATARYAPSTLPFVSLAFTQCFRRLGPRRTLQAFMAESEPDRRLLEDDEILSTLLRGSEIAVGPRFAANQAWAAGAVANYGVDWSDRLRACPVPIILYAGSHDPFAPIATTREYASEIANTTLHECPELGQLVYPRWPEFLADVERHLPT
ncbi:MAG: LuxR C-terminal-related transcriptional regulator [Hyphomicrobiaceae bacterium]|nr:LuxR C-terminal-related transcriptional regulator [Hyphomicrobiaceae bacterium]